VLRAGTLLASYPAKYCGVPMIFGKGEDVFDRVATSACPRYKPVADLSQVIAPIRIPDQIPPTSIEPAVSNVDVAMPTGRRRA
jgi:hypothetical protein